MALLRKRTYGDKASYDSSPPCTRRLCAQHTASHCNTLQHTTTHIARRQCAHRHNEMQITFIDKITRILTYFGMKIQDCFFLLSTLCLWLCLCLQERESVCVCVCACVCVCVRAWVCTCACASACTCVILLKIGNAAGAFITVDGGIPSRMSPSKVH